MSFPSEATCNLLPDHLLELVVAMLNRSCHGDPRQLFALRLVSKAWKAAVATFEAKLYLRLQQATDLNKVCQSFPHLCELDVLSQGTQFSLSPLQQRTRLTGLTLTNKTETDYVEACAHVKLLVDLRLLPFSLRSLDMYGFQMEPATFPELACTQITKLTLRWLSNTAAEICQLLHFLPHLKDANLGPADYWPFIAEEEDLSQIMRNQTLERLELYQCTLLFSTDIASAPALKQLTLAVVKVGRAWLQGLSNALPCLEELIFDCCTDLDKVDEASITPSRTLKDLYIDKDFDGFLTTAGVALESLTLDASASRSVRIAAVSRLTGLTELVLRNIRCSSGFTALCSMPLQSLTLQNCPGTEFLLFVPGALTALRELRFTEAEKDIKDLAEKLRLVQDSTPEAQQEMQIFMQRLQEVGDTVLSLPSLVELSGHSRLLRYGIRDGQNGWKKTANGCGSAEDCFCYECCRPYQQCWTRAYHS